jgi:hypothetical protein
VLPLEGIDIFAKDQDALWLDSVARLQAPRVISY